MIAGARKGKLSGLRRLFARAMARDLTVYLIPGVEIARVNRLDIKDLGMRVVTSPRHANILLIIGKIPSELREHVAVIYAQMMRPRLILSLGSTDLSPLPEADLKVDLSQTQLKKSVGRLRLLLSEEAFQTETTDFEARMLQSRIEYTCSMHPEIVQDKPGSCPKCGMTLIPRDAQATKDLHVEETKSHVKSVEGMVGNGETIARSTDHNKAIEYTCPMHPDVIQDKPGACPKCGMTLKVRTASESHSHEQMHHHKQSIEYTCPMHPDVIQDKPGACPKCGMTLEARASSESHSHEMKHSHEAAIEYTCPMHPDVVQDKPGACPKCGMKLQRINLRNQNMDHNAMDHDSMDHSSMSFMSMIDVTKDLPRSQDGLPMDWIQVPFGPFFPGLPAGLSLLLTLDGDAIAGSQVRSLFEFGQADKRLPLSAVDFILQLSEINPLSPFCYRLLARRALEDITKSHVSESIIMSRIILMEKERICSHLNWLALFAQQTGFVWLMNHASNLQIKIQQADLEQIQFFKPLIQSLIKRLQRTPLLKPATRAIGQLSSNLELYGPVAKASGIEVDARIKEEVYSAIAFKPILRESGDAWARLSVRLDEILQSLTLIKDIGMKVLSDEPEITTFSSGVGKAEVETPRGLARLQLDVDKGRVISAHLITPSTQHITLIEQMIMHQELGDALVAVGSLDISPWEIQP